MPCTNGEEDPIGYESARKGVPDPRILINKFKQEDLDLVTALLCATCTELERINPDLVARNSQLFDWFHEHKKMDAKHRRENQFKFNFMHDLK